MADVQLPPPPEPGPPDLSRPPRQFRVLVRARWDDDWQPAPYLEPLHAELRAAPGDCRATFRYQYGHVKREDATAFAAVDRLDLIDWFVRIELLGAPGVGAPGVVDGGTGGTGAVTLWTGIFAAEALGEHHPVGEAGSDASGDQVFTAYGLEHLLDRCAIRRARAVGRDSAGEAAIVWTDFVPQVNRVGDRGNAPAGNRSSGRHAGPWASGGESHVFSEGDDLTWSRWDLAQYLLAAHPPGETQRLGVIAVALGGQAEALLAGRPCPQMHIEGDSARGVLNRMIDRRRGMGWCMRVDDEDGLAVHVFSAFDEPVAGSGLSIPANAERVTLELDDRIDIADAVGVLSVSAQYDQIRVWGERILTCFSVSFADGNLNALWSGAAQAAYEAGTGEPSDPPGDHDAARGNRDLFRGVFADFNIPELWGWLVRDGEGGGLQYSATFRPNESATDREQDAQTAPPHRDWGHRLEPQLPISAADLYGAGGGELLGPMGFAQDAHGRWFRIDAAQIVDDLGDMIWPRAHIQVLDAHFGVHVEVQPRHRLARNHWSGAPSDYDPEDPAAPGVDYESLVFTVAARTDDRLRVVERLAAAAGDDQADGEPGRVLDIEVPGAELWWVAPNAVTDVSPAGSLMRGLPAAATTWSLPVAVRDDSPRLRDIAAIARAWYARPRRAIRVRLRDVSPEYLPGQLLIAVTAATGRQDIHAVISLVAWDFERQTTEIETQWSELDAAAMA